MEIRSLDNGTEYYVDASGQFAGLVGDPVADASALSVAESVVADLSPQDLMSLTVGLDVEGVDRSNPLVMGLLDQDGDGRFTSQEVLDRVSSNPVAVAELEAAPITETVVLNKPEGSGNYTVEDAFGDVKSIDRKDFTDFKRENDRKLAMIAGTYEPRDADDRREMKAVQERAEMGESAYAKEVRASESDGPYYGVAVGDASSDAGTIKQDASGNWYTVVKNPNSNTVGRDYSIDPQDNSQGPTFGGNVSDYVAETFSDEVAAAGGSTEEPEFIGFTQLLENIVTGKTTDVPSVGFDAGTGTFEAGAAVTEQTFDEAFAANRAAGNDTFEWNGGVYTTDLAPAVDTTPFIPTGGPGTFGPGALPAAEVESVISTGGPGTFVPGSLPAAEYSSLTVGDPLTPQLALELGIGYFEGDALTSADLEDLQSKGFVVDEDAIVGSMNLQLPEDFAEFVGADSKTGLPSSSTGVGANNVTDAILNLTSAMGAGDMDTNEAFATTNLLGGYDLTDADVDALLPPKVETTATDQAMQDLKDLTALEKAGYSLSDIENLTNAQIAAGLGRDVAGGFAQELALRIGGTKKMLGDAFGDEIDVSAGALAGELFELGGGDFQPGSESELEASIQSAIAQTDLNKGVKGLGDSVDQMVSGLNTWSEGVFKGRSDEYKAAVLAGMPDPNNEGFNMLGEPFSITNPGLWMASTAAQELVGLGLDVGTVVALGPVGGSVIGLQQGFAEAGQAGLEEAQAALAEARAAGGLDHLTEAQYQEALQTAGDLAYYTSGPVGAVADTAVALTAGGFAPIAKLAPKMVKAVANALTVTATEAVSGGGEQVAVNNAIIETLKDNGVDVSQIDTALLDGIREAMILEAVGGSTAAGSGAVAGLLSKNETDATKEKVIETANKVLPANTQLDNTGTVIAAGGPGTFVPGALPAASDDANLTASEILESGENVTVSTDSAGNLVLTDNDTNESATVGSSFSTGDTLTGGETTVSDLQGTEDAVIGGTDQNVVVSNVGGNLTLTNEDTGFTAVVGAGTNANLINATSAVQNSDANAAVAAGATVGTDVTASENLLGGDTLGGSTASEALLGGVAGEETGGTDGTLTGGTDVTGTLSKLEAEVANLKAQLENDQGPGKFITFNKLREKESELISAKIDAGVYDVSAISTAYDEASIALSDAATAAAEKASSDAFDDFEPSTVLGRTTGILSKADEEARAQAHKFAYENAIDRAYKDSSASAEVREKFNLTSDELSAILNTQVLTGAAATEVTGSTASENLLGGTDVTASETLLGTDTNVDLGFEGLSDADLTDAESSLEGKTTIVTDGVTTQTGTGGISTIGASDKDILATSIFGGTDVTTDATTDANTTITANNDSTVTTSSDGNVTITTATDSQGNAVVTTKNNVTGETTTDNVAVNNTAVVTNSGVTVNVNAAVDGTTTTMVDPTVMVDPVVSSTITTKPVTSVEEPIFEIDQPQPAVDQPQPAVDQPQTLVAQPQPAVAAPTSYTPPDSDGDPTTDPVGETQPGYTSGIADLGAGGRMRPVVAPYYQPQQTGLYSFYRPQPGVDQTPAAPVFNEPTSYLSPTGGLRYGNPYIGTNLSIEQLRELAELQGTGAAVLPSEDLMNGS